MLHTGLSRSRCAYQAATQQMLIYFFRSSLIYLFIYLFIRVYFYRLPGYHTVPLF